MVPCKICCFPDLGVRVPAGLEVGKVTRTVFGRELSDAGAKEISEGVLLAARGRFFENTISCVKGCPRQVDVVREKVVFIRTAPEQVRRDPIDVEVVKENASRARWACNRRVSLAESVIPSVTVPQPLGMHSPDLSDPRKDCIDCGMSFFSPCTN